MFGKWIEMVHLDRISVSFERQGHSSTFVVTGRENAAAEGLKSERKVGTVRYEKQTGIGISKL